MNEEEESNHRYTSRNYNMKMKDFNIFKELTTHTGTAEQLRDWGEGGGAPCRSRERRWSKEQHD